MIDDEVQNGTSDCDSNQAVCHDMMLLDGLVYKNKINTTIAEGGYHGWLQSSQEGVSLPIIVDAGGYAQVGKDERLTDRCD